MLFSTLGCLAGCDFIEQLIKPGEQPPIPDAKDLHTVTSPNGEITVTVGHLNDGGLKYSVAKEKIAVVESSSLGFDLEECDLTEGLHYVDRSIEDISYEYENLSGKHDYVSGKGKEMTLTFAKGVFVLKVIVRVYNDGYAFRYNLTSKDDTVTTVTINAEQTEFALPKNSYAYVMPYVSSMDEGNYFSYEETFKDRKYNDLSGMTISMPMLYRVGKSEVYSLITESELIGSGYYGSFLRESAENETLGILQTVPTPAGKWAANQTVACPLTTPWRVGIVGDLETVTESELVEAVYGDVEYWKPDNYDELSAEEQEIYNYDWVEAGATSWSWLLYQYTDNSNASQRDWALQKTYVDTAAQMGWKYVLLDGGWDSNNTTELTHFHLAHLEKNGYNDADSNCIFLHFRKARKEAWHFSSLPPRNIWIIPKCGRIFP
jgi:hypothetical protein